MRGVSWIGLGAVLAMVIIAAVYCDASIMASGPPSATGTLSPTPVTRTTTATPSPVARTATPARPSVTASSTAVNVNDRSTATRTIVSTVLAAVQAPVHDRAQ